MATAAKSTASDRAKAANEDLATRVDELRAEMTRLSNEFGKSRPRAVASAKQAASDGMESLKAQGEMAMEKLRENAGELEAEIARRVREKPVTTLAMAVAAGFLLAMFARR